MQLVGKAVRKVSRLHCSCMNAMAPHLLPRWAVTAGLLLAYLASSLHPASDITTYLIAFYLLLVAINYFIPRGLQEEDDDEELYTLDSLDDSLGSFCLPAKTETDLNSDRADDKPLLRAMSEQDVWLRTTLAFALGLVVSYFQMLEIDVFWPLLLLYFVALALYTVFKILKTMQKYRYSLADFKKGPSSSHL